MNVDIEPRRAECWWALSRQNFISKLSVTQATGEELPSIASTGETTDSTAPVAAACLLYKGYLLSPATCSLCHCLSSGSWCTPCTSVKLFHVLCAILQPHNATDWPELWLVKPLDHSGADIPVIPTSLTEHIWYLRETLKEGDTSVFSCWQLHSGFYLSGPCITNSLSLSAEALLGTW